MEDRLVFDSRYRVGVEQVDLEHQKLFELAGRIYDSISLDVIVPMHEIRTAINELIDCTRSHFAHEELLMENSAYPHLEDHRALHADLIARIEDFEIQAEKAELLTPVDVYEFLCSWLGEHILTNDRMFGEFISHRAAALHS
ncbi:MAG: bacteriohemerythrin [Proteobacteria bacterium]|nr:bacteriohemerythrin [Pseudomonadota bacterium]